jgi:hypothetical protein
MMTDQEIKQRIAYLVEHGGICDDPLADIRKMLRFNRVVATLAVIMAGTLVALHLVE